MAAARDGRALFTFWRWDSLRPKVGSIGHSPVDRRVRARLRDYSSSVRIQAARPSAFSRPATLGGTYDWVMIVPVPDEIEFRITITILFALTLIVRSYYQLQSLRSGKSEQFESPGNVAVRSIAGIALLCGIAIYVFRPQSL